MLSADCAGVNTETAAAPVGDERARLPTWHVSHAAMSGAET